MPVRVGLGGERFRRGYRGDVGVRERRSVGKDDSTRKRSGRACQHPCSLAYDDEQRQQSDSPEPFCRHEPLPHHDVSQERQPLDAHLLVPDAHGGSEPIADKVVVSRVAQAVAAILRTLTPADGNPFDGERPHRQAEIVRRCITGSEPYKAVARDLAISLRTLFRDLDGIRLRLVEELPRYAPPSATVAEVSNTFELELR